MVGLAVRNAVTLGLHIRSEATRLSDLQKELQIRVWWSLFSLEILLNEITGRPCCISYRDISAPHPVNYSEEELFTLDKSRTGDSLHSTTKRRHKDGKGKGKGPEIQHSREMFGLSTVVNSPSVFTKFTTTTYFIHRTALNVLTNEVLNRLFCAAVVKIKWNEVQDIIREIDGRLQKWKSNLPDELRFALNESEEEDGHRYQKKGLAVMYHSARMILNRPALCRMEGRIKNESSASQKFNRDAVTKCVDSARALLATIGKPADPTKLYLIPPCWEILPHLCQAVSILMLEISFCAHHIKNEAHEILQDAKDAIQWLRVLSRLSIHARQAWQMHDQALRLVAINIGGDISDMSTEAELPPGWDQQSSKNFDPPTRQETVPEFDRFRDRLSGIQAQNLAATSAWVESSLFQSAAAPQPEMGQMYASNQYSNQPNFSQGRFEPGIMDPYSIFDSPGFPWYGQQPSFVDPRREMQWEPEANLDTTYQPYDSGEMRMPSHLEEDTTHPSQLQENPNVQNTDHGYQEEQYPTEESYRQQWQQGGGDGGS